MERRISFGRCEDFIVMVTLGGNHGHCNLLNHNYYSRLVLNAPQGVMDYKINKRMSAQDRDIYNVV